MVIHHRSAPDHHVLDSIAVADTLAALPRTLRSDSVSPPAPNQSITGISRPPRVLMVDDDIAIQNMVVAYLEEHGTRVTVSSDRQDAARRIAAEKPDLILLAVQFGRQNGLDMLREIRSRSNIPVIIADGEGAHEIDRVVGLELGADDYVTKPFGLRELLARIHAILRRREITPATARPDPEQGGYLFGGWRLDRRIRRLTSPDGKPVSLTKGEYSLLIAFLDAPQRPLTREYLMNATRIHEDAFDRSMDVQILRLRRKIEIDPSEPRVIRTVRGVGYCLDLPVERTAGRWLGGAIARPLLEKSYLPPDTVRRGPVAMPERR